MRSPVQSRVSLLTCDNHLFRLRASEENPSDALFFFQLPTSLKQVPASANRQLPNQSHDNEVKYAYLRLFNYQGKEQCIHSLPLASVLIASCR